MKKHLFTFLLTVVGCTLGAAPAATAAKEAPAMTLANMEKYNRAVCKILAGNNGEAESCGTCFLVSENGYFITNYHVVEGCTQFVAFISSPMTGKTEAVPVQPIRIDVDHDLALLKATRTTSLPAPLKLETNASAATPLQDVVAIGFPAVLDQMEREMAQKRGELPMGAAEDAALPIYTKGSIAKVSGERITHTATIAPGNSGGPLVSASTGKVLGVNYMRVSETGSSYFFALPSRFVLNLMDGTGGMVYRNAATTDHPEKNRLTATQEPNITPEQQVVLAKLQAVAGLLEILTTDDGDKVPEVLAAGIDEITKALKELNEAARQLDQAAIAAAEEEAAKDEDVAKLLELLKNVIEVITSKNFYGCVHLKKAIVEFADAL